MAIECADDNRQMLSLTPARVSRIVLMGIIGLMVANCGQAPRTASRLSGQEGREAGSFADKKYGTASPRVVADGEEVPKGGGRDHVGKPYTVAGKRYVPYQKPTGYTATGNASWYGPAFHGRKTANGEIYDRFGVSAAHPTMPLPSYARVTNVRNKRSIIVRVNDRGPFHGNRIIDLSQKTADALDFRHLGTTQVKVEYLGRASMRGSDDRKLLATLTTDGSPASFPGQTAPATMIASAEPIPAPASTSIVQRSAPQVAAVSTPEVVLPSASVSPLSQQPITVALAEPNSTSVGRIVRGIPTPPDRPFDLGTIPNAGIPVAEAVPGSSVTSRAQVASLFYAEPESQGQFDRTGRFDRSGPLSKLKNAGFQRLDKPAH
jgi:rare lipoprotein A